MKNPVQFYLTPEVQALFRERPGLSPRAVLEVALLGASASPQLPPGGRVNINLSERARDALDHLLRTTGVNRTCLLNDLLRGALLSWGHPRRAILSSGATRASS